MLWRVLFGLIALACAIGTVVLAVTNKNWGFAAFTPFFLFATYAGFVHGSDFVIQATDDPPGAQGTARVPDSIWWIGAGLLVAGIIGFVISRYT